jgi:hypothetical protein
MAAITVQKIPKFGQPLAVAWEAGSTPATLSNDGNVYLKMKNISSPTASVTVDIEGVPAPDSGRDATISVVLAAAGDEYIAGPFRSRNFNNGDGDIDITVSAGLPADLEWIAVSPSE